MFKKWAQDNTKVMLRLNTLLLGYQLICYPWWVEGKLSNSAMVTRELKHPLQSEQKE